ncbi:MAG: hypothetical protein RLZZ399_1847 [Verrucomicrobiota bacterium]|jgi:hypothetical protein
MTRFKPTVLSLIAKLDGPIRLWVLALHGLGWSMPAFAFQQTAIAASPRILPSVPAFLEEHCTKCHDTDSQKGGLDLTTLLDAPNSPENLHRWEYVFDRVLSAEMPPPKKKQPAESDRQSFLRELREHLIAVCLDQKKTVGRVQSRRLTRAEFERSLQELLAIQIPLLDGLPEDPLTDGFSTVAKGQQISPNQLSSQLNVIDEALTLAFQQAINPPVHWKKNLSWEELRRHVNGSVGQARGPEGRPTQGDVVSWNTFNNEFYGRMDATKVPADGWYRIRLRALAVNPPRGERLSASVFSGKHVSTAPERRWVGAIEAEEQPADFEFTSWMKAGELLRVQVCDDSLPKKRAQRHPQNREAIEDLDGLGHAGIAVQSVEIERVYPEFSAADTRTALFGELSPPAAKQPPAGGGNSPQAATSKRDLETQVLAFANRAFRRPVSKAEIESFVDLAASKLAAGASLNTALQSTYRGLLMSPRFLYLEEAPGALDAHAVASRLSFFLWGGPPDASLRRLADSGKLLETKVLLEQVQRLLDHPNANRFVQLFTNQWLKLGEIDATNPDEKLYPEFDDVLKTAMLEETRHFFADLIRRNRSASNLVDSNHTFLSHRLAKHYGVPPLPEPGVREVPLRPEFHRGGVITHASVLKITANGTTTSPVLRGVWMLERITGQRVPPPPPGTPAIEPDIRGAKTIREQLDKHRSQESCASCHAKIDPPGFALENYDVIGGWREKYRAVNEKGVRKDGLPVDASAVLHDGQQVRNLQEWKKNLLTRPEWIAQNLVHHLATYATGAAPSFADRECIEAIVASAKVSDYGVRSLIEGLVQSPIFLHK